MRFHALVVVAFIACATAPAPVRAPAPTRVLFVGNSLTYFNDMPRLFERYVEAAYRRTVTTKMIAPPGETLAGHRRKGTALAEIRTGGWDHVVLQDRGIGSWSLDGEKHAALPDHYVEDVTFFTDAVHAQGGTPVIYQNWSREPMQPFVEYATALAAHKGGAVVAPIGRAWSRLDETSLLDEDQIHPSLQGSVLVAVTLAHAMFGPPPVRVEELGGVRLQAIEAAAVAAAGRVIDPPRPEYQAIPTVRAQAPIATDVLTGVWRARRGGTRLSAGTELAVRPGPEVVVREYTASERVETKVAARIENDVLRFTVTSGSVAFDFALSFVDGTLRGLSARGDDLKSVRFERDGDRDYFTALDALYQQRDREEATAGLAKALEHHYPRLVAFVGEPAMKEIREGHPLSEWDQILTAWFYAESNEPRAFAYFHAAVELHPTSLDAHFYLADALAQTGQPAAAREAYEHAKAIYATTRGANPQIGAAIDAALAKLATTP